MIPQKFLHFVLKNQMESGAFKGPGSTRLHPFGGVHSEFSSSSFRLVAESSLEAANLKIPELPPPLSQVDMFRLWSHHQD